MRRSLALLSDIIIYWDDDEGEAESRGGSVVLERRLLWADIAVSEVGIKDDCGHYLHKFRRERWKRPVWEKKSVGISFEIITDYCFCLGFAHQHSHLLYDRSNINSPEGRWAPPVFTSVWLLSSTYMTSVLSIAVSSPPLSCNCWCYYLLSDDVAHHRE